MTQPNSTRFDLRATHYIGLVGCLVFLCGAPLGMPFNIGAIIDAFGVSKAAAGTTATFELFAISIASLLTARFSDRLPARRMLVATLLLAALFNASTIFAGSIEAVVASRFFAGIVEGAGMSTIISIAARSSRPVLAFGLINASVGGFIIPLSQAIHIPITQFGVDGAYGLYLALNLVGLLFVPLLPRPQAASNAEDDQAPQAQSPATTLPAYYGWVGLVGLFVIFFSHGGMLLFSERIALGVGMQLAEYSNLLTVGGVLTVAGSLLVGTFGARMRATLPAILFVGLMVLLAYPIGTAATPLTLFLVLPVFAAIPIAWLPVFLGALVRLDPSGRFAAANPAFVTMGGALAPMITGFIADRAGFPVLGIFTACAILVGLALCLLTCVKADRLER